MSSFSDFLYKVGSFIADAEWDALKVQAQSFAFFVVAMLLYFAVIAFREKDFSLRGVFGRAFPKKIYAGPSLRVDFLNFVVQGGVLFPFLLIGSGILAVTVGDGLSEALNGWLGPRAPVLHATWAIVAVQVAGIYVISNLFDYWQHYALHHVPWLWSIHRAHHSTESLSLFASTRGHPSEIVYTVSAVAFGTGLGTALTLYFTGTQLVPATTSIVGAILTITILSGSVLGHSHMPLSYGWFNLVIPGPIMHQLHHSAETHHRDRNLAASALIFDWMFGTLYIPKKGEIWRTGLNEQELGENNPHKSLKDLYLEPVRHMRQQIKGSWASRGSRAGAPASQQSDQTQSEGEAARGSNTDHGVERVLVDGLPVDGRGPSASALLRS